MSVKPGQVLETIDGNHLDRVLNEDGIILNGVARLASELAVTSNGVIHTIATVGAFGDDFHDDDNLLDDDEFPFFDDDYHLIGGNSIEDVLRLVNDFDAFRFLLADAGVALDDGGPYTLFALEDESIEAISGDALPEFLSPERIVSYIVPGAYTGRSNGGDSGGSGWPDDAGNRFWRSAEPGAQR